MKFPRYINASDQSDSSGVAGRVILHSKTGACMHTITLTLPDDRLLKLREIAQRLGVAPEELVRASVEELLDRPEEAFERVVDYILKKNVELYQRLA
jgi:hypothetical protein